MTVILMCFNDSEQLASHHVADHISIHPHLLHLHFEFSSSFIFTSSNITMQAAHHRVLSDPVDTRGPLNQTASGESAKGSKGRRMRFTEK